MKKIKKLSLIFFILLSTKILAESYLPDSEYYEKGIQHYKSAEFSEAYIIFFNLAVKGDTDSQHNLANMYSGGIGTPQNYKDALKYSWLCALGGQRKCGKILEKVKLKLDEKSIEEVATFIENHLEKELYKTQNIQYALKLGFWFEKFSPEKNLEQAYLWYSISVTGGLYKAMEIRDNVSDKLESETLVKLQTEANEIFTKVKFFNNTNGDLK